MDSKENLISEQVQKHMHADKGLFSQYLYITVIVAIYWIVSISTVFINKFLLSSDAINSDAPIFITWFQCVISVLICIILNILSKHFPQVHSFEGSDPWNTKTIRKVLPLSILFAGMIASNNLCLKFVGVAFYYIGRSLTTVFNVIFTYLILGQKTSIKCVFCCGVIVAGFWLGVDQENIAGSLSVQGTIYGVLGSLCLSLYSIQTKRVLSFVNEDIWLLSYYNNIYSVILFIPLILFNGEHIIIYNYDKLGDIFYWFTMITGGIFGFAIGYVTALQIKVTSPLTHNISGTAKACAQTVMASFWYDEKRSILWWLSNFIVLAASAAYAKIRQIDLSKGYKQRMKSSRI